MNKHLPPKLKELPVAKQRRLDELLERNSEGTITRSEKVRLEQLVADAERLMIANAQLLARFSQQQGVSLRTGAVPVTVWVKPEHTGR